MVQSLNLDQWKTCSSSVTIMSRAWSSSFLENRSFESPDNLTFITWQGENGDIPLWDGGDLGIEWFNRAEREETTRMFSFKFRSKKGQDKRTRPRTFAPESWIFRQGYHSDNIRFDATIIQQMVSFAPFTSCSIPIRVLAPLSLHPTSCPCACTHIYISAIRSYF